MKRGAQRMSARKIKRIHENPKLRPNYTHTRLEVLTIAAIALTVGYSFVVSL